MFVIVRVTRAEEHTRIVLGCLSGAAAVLERLEARGEHFEWYEAESEPPRSIEERTRATAIMNQIFTH